MRSLLLSLYTIILSTVACSPPSQPDVATDAHSSALTEDQCHYFDVNGKISICHATHSARNPYVLLKVNESACVNAHSEHNGDYVAVNDPTCQGLGCLPLNAP